jgi:hypothetical protein
VVGAVAAGACLVAIVGSYFSIQTTREVSALRQQLRLEQQRTAAALGRISENVAALVADARIPCPPGQAPMDPTAIERVVHAVSSIADREDVDWEREIAASESDERTQQQLRAFEVGEHAVDSLLHSATLTEHDSHEIAKRTAGLHDADRQTLRLRLSAAINAGQLHNEASELPF